MKFSDVVRSEAASILGSASKLTNKAKAGDINKRYTIKRSTKKSRKSGPVVQNKELVPFVILRGKKYHTSNYYPTAIWQEIKKKLDFYKKRGKARIYSGKATWLLMARKAKLNTSRFPAKGGLEKAISAQGGGYARNTTENGTQIKKLFRFRIKIYNNAVCALNKAARGHFAIKSAMGRREKFFATNMKKGTFNQFDKIAKAYPGIKTSSMG